MQTNLSPSRANFLIDNNKQDIRNMEIGFGL